VSKNVSKWHTNMNTWATINCHPYVGVHTILDIWISVSEISKILGWLSWLSQFGDVKMKHFPAGILDVGWVLIHYVLISKGSQLWSGMAIHSFLGGVKQKSLCSGFSAGRAALEKLKYGLWTRMWRPALSHVWGSRFGFKHVHNLWTLAKTTQIWTGERLWTMDWDQLLSLIWLSDHCELDLRD
jgi:hypothetical protein